MDFTSTIVRPNSSGPITDNIQSIVATNVDDVINEMAYEYFRNNQ